MKNKETKHSKQNRPRILILLGLLIAISVAPIEGTLAQNPSDDSAIYIPIFSGSGMPASATQQAQGETGDHGEHDHGPIGHILENGRFTANDGADSSWPPQVKYIKDVSWDTSAARTRSMQIDEAETLSDMAARDPSVEMLLGDRFTFINSAPIRVKWEDEVQGHRITYFSYSNNITIEAVVRDGMVDTIDTFTASEYQPPLRKNEVDAAVEIARQYWLEQGNGRVNDLEGFTIQTLRDEGEGGYYDTRMTYVSFHQDETSNPELLTWVDLTNEEVVRAEVDRGGQ